LGHTEPRNRRVFFIGPDSIDYQRPPDLAGLFFNETETPLVRQHGLAGERGSSQQLFLMEEALMKRFGKLTFAIAIVCVFALAVPVHLFAQAGGAPVAGGAAAGGASTGAAGAGAAAGAATTAGLTAGTIAAGAAVAAAAVAAMAASSETTTPASHH
jgi:hypothetical protein